MKKALSLIMAFAMVFALALALAPAAEAADLNTHTHDSTWTELNKDNLSTYLFVPDATKEDNIYLKEGKYYLTSDIELPWIQLEYDVETTICLNGHTITSSPEATSSLAILDVQGQTTVLNICDCKGGGIVTRTAKNGNDNEVSRYGCLINARNKCVVNIYGGKFIGPSVNKDKKASNIYGFGTSTINIYNIESVETPGCFDIGVNSGAGSKLNIYGTKTDITIYCEKDDKLFVDESLTVSAATKMTINGGELGGIRNITVPAAKPPVNTGDNTNVTLMVAGLLIGLCGIASVAILPKKQSI